MFKFTRLFHNFIFRQIVSAFVFALLLQSTTLKAFADDSGDDKQSYPTVFDHYFTVDDENVSLSKSWRSSEQMMGASIFAQGIATVKDAFTQPQFQSSPNDLDLLRWNSHNEEFGNTPEKYNRKLQFGIWIKERKDGKCFYTRAEVLARDSASPVERNPKDACVVTRGDWNDPYSGQHFTNPSDIQIDHFVPLKNAYVSGAWNWNQKKRCLYANFLKNDIHLVSVSGEENMSKSDHGPDRYMPSNNKFQCEYLKRWLQIKLIWHLGMTPLEANAINRIRASESCSQQAFWISSKSISAQRQDILENLSFCENPPITQ